MTHSKKNWARYDKNVCWSLCKLTFILVRFQRNFNFRDGFPTNAQISDFMNIRPVGAELFHADGRTNGHDETKSRFSKFRIHA
jgi:hypothetical protein